MSFLRSLLGKKQSEITLSSSKLPYKVGQVWQYRTRPNETGSTFTIVKIEVISDTIIVHISLQGLQVATPSGYVKNISHMPFTEEAITDSVTRLTGTLKDLPAYEENYNKWKQATSMVFSLPVSEAVEYVQYKGLTDRPYP